MHKISTHNHLRMGTIIRRIHYTPVHATHVAQENFGRQDSCVHRTQHLFYCVYAQLLYCSMMHSCCIAARCTAVVLQHDAQLLYCSMMHSCCIAVGCTAVVLQHDAQLLYCSTMHSCCIAVRCTAVVLQYDAQLLYCSTIQSCHVYVNMRILKIKCKNVSSCMYSAVHKPIALTEMERFRRHTLRMQLNVKYTISI